MTAVALNQQHSGPDAQLRADVIAVLKQTDARRMATSTLHLMIRKKGWGGWSYPNGWEPVCLRLGLYVYKGHTVRGRAVTWVGLDQPSEVAPDEFINRGFVVIDSAGRYYRRDQDCAYVDEFTSLRSRARVWVSFAWASRRIAAMGSDTRLQVGSTYHMR